MSIDFQHNIVKLATYPQGNSRVDLQTSWTMSISGEPHEKIKSEFVFLLLTNVATLH